jgi:hypothetical protein
MHRLLATGLIAGSLSASALATATDLSAQQGARDSAAARSYHMVTYYLVLLRRGPTYKTTQDSTVKAILAGHMTNIERLAREGKMAVAGPIDGDTRGIERRS